jgi:hypothetical protein
MSGFGTTGVERIKRQTEALTDAASHAASNPTPAGLKAWNENPEP